MNKRNRVNVQIVKEASKAVKLIAKPTYRGFDKVPDGLYTFSMKTRRVMLNTAIYSGFVILELAKLLVYDYHYDKIIQWFGENNVSLLMTDTDSLYYELRLKTNLFSELKKYEGFFDYSDYPRNLSEGDAKKVALFSPKNRKIVGKLKDDLDGDDAVEFIALSSKCYSIDIKNGKRKMAAKGVKRGVQKKLLRHQFYQDVLKDQIIVYATSKFLNPSYKKGRAGMFTTELRKQSLSSFDSKRYLCSDNVNTLSFGHYLIRN